MAVPEEELRKQVAAGEETPSLSYRSFDPFVQYLLHRLDTLEANLRSEVNGLRQEVNGLRQEVNGLRQEMNARIDAVHQELHSTTRWIIGTVIAAAGVAVALAQVLR